MKARSIAALLLLSCMPLGVPIGIAVIAYRRVRRWQYDRRVAQWLARQPKDSGHPYRGDAK